MKYTEEKLREAIKLETSVCGVIRRLGGVVNGGTHSFVSRKIKLYEIDISHFLGLSANRGKTPKTKKTPEQLLVVLAPNAERTKVPMLRRALLESGIEHVCSLCKLPPLWCDKKLILQIDHIDGNFRNNQKDNLRFLCPNCHTQTATYCRNHKK